MNLNDIPLNKKFNGYYWLSDSEFPVVLNNEEVDFSVYENSNPFIQEAYFSDNIISYCIKHFDGIGHTVVARTLSEIENLSELTCLPAPQLLKINQNIKYLSFIQVWNDVEDILCENMKTLQPGVVLFKEFIN